MSGLKMRRCFTSQVSQTSVNLKSATSRNRGRIQTITPHRTLYSAVSVCKSSPVLSHSSRGANEQSQVKFKNKYSPYAVNRRFLAHYDKPKVLESVVRDDDDIPMIGELGSIKIICNLFALQVDLLSLHIIFLL